MTFPVRQILVRFSKQPRPNSKQVYASTSPSEIKSLISSQLWLPIVYIKNEGVRICCFVLCVSNCYLFMLPTFPVSCFFLVEEIGMVFHHYCWCISLEIKSMELNKTNLVKKNSRFIEWWVGGAGYVLSSGTHEIFNLYCRLSDVICGTAQVKSQILKDEEFGKFDNSQKTHVSLWQGEWSGCL